MENSQLKTLLENSTFISETLADLRAQFSGEHKSRLTASEEIDRAILLREAFRTQTEGLAVNRNLVQLKKEQIEKSRIFLEGLQYFKTTLKSKIKECEIPTEDLSDYIQKPLVIQDWEQDFQPVQQALQQQLEQIKLQENNYRLKLQQRDQLNKEIKNKQKLYNQDLPHFTQKLYEQVQEASRIFGIPAEQQLKPIEDPKLAKIFDMLYPLKDSQRIKISVEKDQYECIQVTLKENGQYRLCKVAAQNLCSTELKSLKIVFAAFDSYIVIGVDRSSDFTTEEIFQRVINNEAIKPVFSQPQNESERNTNNKFCFLDWVEYALCSGVMSGIQFLEVIRHRLFSVQINKYLLENIKKVPYFRDFSRFNEVKPNIKKINFSEAGKITFEEYLALVEPPAWVNKELIRQQLQQTNLVKSSFEERLKMGEASNSLAEILSAYQIEEILTPRLNNYYKVRMNVANESFTIIIIVPHSYPKNPSKMKFVEHEKKRSEVVGVQQGLCECYYYQKQRLSQLNASVISMERQVNSSKQAEQFLKGSDLASFRLFVQINRLIAIVSNWQERNSQGNNAAFGKWQIQY